ncbi:hypothetical protein [Staphylococcus saprophyticus]|uniref:hypothetical protein n=1 Tax=Staphylococcus saprophyticus TaxID=29385 RepID=UPI0034C65591
MIGIMLVSTLIVIFALIIKIFTSFSSDFEPITYLKKKSLIRSTIKLILKGIGLYVWILLLDIIFNKNARHDIDSILQSNNINDLSTFVFCAIMIFTIITSVLMFRILLNLFSIIRIIITLQKQKRSDIETIFVRSLYNDSNEEIVRKYKNWVSIPFIDRRHLYIEDAMKLITALLSQKKYEEAQKISEFYIRGNNKIINKQNSRGITQITSNEK